jgi:hypothetical protein
MYTEVNTIYIKYATFQKNPRRAPLVLPLSSTFTFNFYQAICHTRCVGIVNRQRHAANKTGRILGTKKHVQANTSIRVTVLEQEL